MAAGRPAVGASALAGALVLLGAAHSAHARSSRPFPQPTAAPVYAEADSAAVPARDSLLDLRRPSPGTATAGVRSWPADSMRVRFEAGGSYDYTNEIYYLDSLATPTLTTRQRFDVPQARSAGVLLATLEGTRAAGRTGYALSQELSLGDRLRRASLLARWRQQPAPEWRLLVIPRAEYRRDRTLGRDFEEYQASNAARIRREWGAGLTALEAGLQGDWLHTTGSGAGLLADRWSVALATAGEHGDFAGPEFRLDYTFRGRFFPDSVVRDHLEHETRGRVRLGWGLAHALTLEAASIRRVTIHLAPTSLDNFWEETGTADLLLSGASLWGAAAHLDAEAVQFDLQDEVLYFDHQLVRARAGPRLQPVSSWTFEAGPRLEWVGAPAATQEAYTELAGYAEYESISAGSLWSVTPAAGRRRYRDSGTTDTSAGGTTPLHTSYRFVELDLLGDQRLFGAWRARIAANGRWEFHDESVENAGSLYFSLDVRRLF